MPTSDVLILAALMTLGPAVSVAMIAFVAWLALWVWPQAAEQEQARRRRLEAAKRAHPSMGREAAR